MIKKEVRLSLKVSVEETKRLLSLSIQEPQMDLCSIIQRQAGFETTAFAWNTQWLSPHMIEL